MKELVQAFEGHKVRTVIIKREPWWVAKDILTALGMDSRNVSQAVERLEPDEKGQYTISTLGGEQSLHIINESGLYALIFSSRKEEAKRFRKWVTSEVLPMIRRTGRFELSDADKTKSKQARGFLTAQWAEHGASSPRDFQNLTRRTYQVCGMGWTAKKENMDRAEIAKLAAFEAVEAWKLIDDPSIEGYHALDDSIKHTGLMLESVRQKAIGAQL